MPSRRAFWDRLPIIEPDSNYKLVFDIIIYLILLVFYFEIPIEILVDNQIKSEKFKIGSFLNIFTYISFPFLVVDYLIPFNEGNFNSSPQLPIINSNSSFQAYYDKGELIENRRAIVLQYLKFRFILNTISLVGVVYDIFIDDIKYTYLSLLIFFRFYSVFSIHSQIKRRRFKSKFATASYQIFYLFLLIFLVGHIIACIFMGVSIYLKRNQNYNDSDTWIASYEVYSVYPIRS